MILMKYLSSIPVVSFGYEVVMLGFEFINDVDFRRIDFRCDFRDLYCLYYLYNRRFEISERFSKWDFDGINSCLFIRFLALGMPH
ncbi:hypothetical protein RchiOBHm_Chr1g0314061 [Rosa chinensis]|uniref:Uncharacterized protein n=1 Tax=Rosa chinensis TaxID=74649 RepID=A0A2P6S766_ROSCH|nr:hypothetical protein RchiOBHm_Chr1g0314061 [Rosa chinensis]